MRDRDQRPTSEQGLFRKYEVQRVDGKDDGDDPHYLVLRISDLTSGKPEVMALAAYIAAAAANFPALADDLRRYLPGERAMDVGSSPPDARAQAAAILAAEAQRLAAFVPPPCDPNDSMCKRAAASGAIMRADEVAFLTALAAFLRGEPPPEGNPYTITFERKRP